jgi:hypothetical protein
VVLTPRFGIIFSLVLAVIVLGEWLHFFRGFDTTVWSFSNWLILTFALLGQALAVGIIIKAVDHALPAPGGRAPTKTSKSKRRSRQDYRAR